MTEVKLDVFIEAKPEQVFEYLLDEAKTLEWMEGLTAITRVDNTHDGDWRQGDKFTFHIKEGRRINAYDGTLVAYNPPYELKNSLQSNVFVFHNHYKLTPEGDGTRFEFSYEMDTGGKKFAAFLAKLFAGFTKKIAKGQLTKLKEIVEAGA